MIVVDGRTDHDKLVELLAIGSEQTELEFKSPLDMDDPRTGLDFVKDCLAMANLPDGGYIIVGADDNGVPVQAVTAVNPKQFESATLQDRVRRFADSSIVIISRIHQIDDHDIVIIFVQSDRAGLPIPVAKLGQYQDGRTQKVVLRPGEIWVRDGAQNQPLKYQDWGRLLARYRAQVRAEAREQTDNLVRELLASIAESRGTADSRKAPLVLDLADDVFAGAVVDHLDDPTMTQLRRVLIQARTLLKSQAPSIEVGVLGALDKITIIALTAVEYDRMDLFELAVGYLHEAYLAAPTEMVGYLYVVTNPERAAYWLQVIARAFAIGSLATRLSRWAMVRSLTLRPVTVAPDYSYGSWFRHAVTHGSRANLLETSGVDLPSRGAVLSLARETIRERRSLRPDVLDSQLPPLDQVYRDDALLNSLCQFDLWWCTIVQTFPDGRDVSEQFYPSCSAFDQFRSQPAIDTIAGNPSVREQAFPGATDGQVATALNAVLVLANLESRRYHGHWDRTGSDSASRFLTEHYQQP